MHYFKHFFVWATIVSRREFTRIGALAFNLDTKNCSPQHFNNLRNSFFFYR